jgi:putative restriction endonuclease
MAFWWVNHTLTFDAEIYGGFIWSPKTRRDGGYHQTYTNLTETKPGNIVFSGAKGEIKAIGVVTSECREQSQPSEFRRIMDDWANIGWAVPIEWEVLDSPFPWRDYLDPIVPLLPTKHSPIQANGNVYQGRYLCNISDALGNLLINIAYNKNLPSVFIVNQNIAKTEDEEEELKLLATNIEPTEKDQLIKARKGQGKFRLNVERNEKYCRVTKVSRKDLLIASHIKPWRFSSNEERLNGSNGLLLSPHVDKLFDQGWISFTNDGWILCSADEIKSILISWGIEPSQNVGQFSEKQRGYLDFHRKHVYKVSSLFNEYSKGTVNSTD